MGVPQASGKGKGRKRNPIGKDGQVLKCFGCGSETHLREKCPNPSPESYFQKGKGFKGRGKARGAPAPSFWTYQPRPTPALADRPADGHTAAPPPLATGSSWFVQHRNDDPPIVAPTPSYFNIADTDEEAPGPLDELLGVSGSGAQHHYVRINDEPTAVSYTHLTLPTKRIV